MQSFTYLMISITSQVVGSVKTLKVTLPSQPLSMLIFLQNARTMWWMFTGWKSEGMLECLQGQRKYSYQEEYICWWLALINRMFLIIPVSHLSVYNFLPVFISALWSNKEKVHLLSHNGNLSNIDSHFSKPLSLHCLSDIFPVL